MQNAKIQNVTQLLEHAGVLDGAREVTFRVITGAAAILSLEDAREALIATYVGDEPLNQAHGFPTRLVAPTRRGYHWIKWMNQIVVS